MWLCVHKPLNLHTNYDNTVTFLTDDCGVGAYSMATGKAVTYGLLGGLWGASKGSFWGVAAGDSIEGLANISLSFILITSENMQLLIS